MVKLVTMPNEQESTEPDLHNQGLEMQVFEAVMGEYDLNEALLRTNYAKRRMIEGGATNLIEAAQEYNSLSVEERIDFARTLGEERREALRLAKGEDA